MSDNPLDQVSDLVRALNTLSLALENNPQQRAPAAASAAPAGSSPAREDSFELITEEPSPSQVQGIRTQPVQIAYNNNSFAETIPPVPHWILRDCQSLVAGELGKQAFEQPPHCKAESGHLEHIRAFHFVQRSTSSFEHLDWKHQQECQTLRIFTGSQDAWKEATWCATLSHHCLKPTSIVKEPDPASLHNINGADPKKVPGRWPSNHEDFGVASCRRSGLLYLHAGGYSVVQRGGSASCTPGPGYLRRGLGLLCSYDRPCMVRRHW